MESTVIPDENDEKEVKVSSVVLTEHGSFDHIKIIEWPLAQNCGPKEVKVAVNFCGVNFADVYHVQGQLLQTSVPYVMGLECTGKVIAIGSDVEHINVGDRVVCYKPETGLFRETVVVASHQCFPIPQDICSKIACSLLANYLTAYFALLEFGNLRSGQSVLIHSAAGGVGWAATQLASNVVTNVQVYGTASESKHDDILNNGVTVALTYDNYMDHLKKPDIDIIVDNIGGPNIKNSLSLLNPLGRVILTGANSVVQADEAKSLAALSALGTSVVPMQEIVVGNKAVCGLHLGTLFQQAPTVVAHAVQHIFTLCQQGLIEPRIHAVFPFHKASEAIKALAERKNIGKVLLRIE